jgi:hypothetical protein
MAFGGSRRNSELFMAQLLTGATIEQCATNAGISVRTAYRYLADSKFQAAFRDRRKAVLDRATLKLTDSLDIAIDVLLEISRDRAQPAAPRSSSAAQIIKQAFLNAGLGDIEERIRMLEDRNRNTGNHNPQE